MGSIWRFPADDAGAAALAYVEEWRTLDPDHHRVNVLVAGPGSSATVHVILRDTRKSHAAAKGFMGGFKVCGDFVYSEPTQRDGFERASASPSRSLLCEIRPVGV